MTFMETTTTATVIQVSFGSLSFEQLSSLLPLPASEPMTRAAFHVSGSLTLEQWDTFRSTLASIDPDAYVSRESSTSYIGFRSGRFGLERRDAIKRLAAALRRAGWKVTARGGFATMPDRASSCLAVAS